jgi:putative DNA primase/helicase
MPAVTAKLVASVLTLAKTDRRLAMTPDQFDRDPWLFNTPGGTIELKTGKMREHRPLDYITTIAGATPCGECPLFLEFLDTIFAGDQELIDYVQKALGYSLTGDTREHALFFFYGTGANGKSVLVSTIAGILGDYHKTAPVDTFTAQTMPQHTTDLAGLRAARLVTSTETEEGKRWAESKIKSLTGGDKISARFMRCDFFEYTPQFKLIISGNHKPGLRSSDPTPASSYPVRRHHPN